MATSTTRLQLRKPADSPAGGDNVNVVTDLNNNYDQIDEHIGLFVCTSGTRPTGADRFTGRTILETDTNNRYYWTGTDWFLINKLLRRKSANQVRNNTTSLVADTHITFPLDVGTWEIDTHLGVKGPASGDFKTNWSFSGTFSQIRRFADGQAQTGTDANATAMARNAETAHNVSYGFGMDSVVTTYIREKFFCIVTAAGTFLMNWDQVSPVASDTTVFINSFATAERLA